MAKVFGNKFTHISPVWLQVKRKGDENYEITGTHDVDNDWIADVKTSGKERGVKSMVLKGQFSFLSVS